MEYYQKTIRYIKPQGNVLTRGLNITIVINFACNLHCYNYCPMYIHGDKRDPKAKTCTADEWKQMLEKFMKDQHIAECHISGGEPSLYKELPDLVNWLTEKNTHVVIYSNLAIPETLAKLNKTYKLRVKAVYHHEDDLNRFNKAFDSLKGKFYLRACEIELPRKIKGSELLYRFTDAEIENFTLLHFAPDSPRTGHIYMGCATLYAEAKK